MRAQRSVNTLKQFIQFEIIENDGIMRHILVVVETEEVKSLLPYCC